MKIIYDENKINSVKSEADEINKKLMSEKKKETVSNVRFFSVLIAICIVVSIACGIYFYNFYIIKELSILDTYVWICAVALFCIAFTFAIIFADWIVLEKKCYRRDVDEYEKHIGDFTYPACVRYSQMVGNENLHSFSINGNFFEDKVNVDVVLENSEGVMRTETLYDFEVYRGVYCKDTVIDLMNSRVIYPYVEDKQKLDFCTEFCDNALLKKI